MFSVYYINGSKWLYDRKSKTFCQKQIEGKLKECYADRAGTNFKLVNNDEMFWFNPLKSNHSKEAFTFCRKAKEGDKIIKEAGSSILYLVNNLDTISIKFHCP